MARRGWPLADAMRGTTRARSAERSGGVRSTLTPSPCRLGASRAELCGALRGLKGEKEGLRDLTLRQRAELQGLDDDYCRLRAGMTEVDLARADLDCETCAARCAADVARLELRQVEGERRRLEQELSTWRGGVTRLRDEHEATARLDAERAVAEEDMLRLEREVASTREQLASLEAAAGQTHSARAAQAADVARCQSTVAAVEDEISRQRRLREDAEQQQRAALAELATLRAGGVAVRSAVGPLCVALGAKVISERSRLAELRQSLSDEREDRRRRAAEIQAALAELDVLRQALTPWSASHTEASHRTLTCLRLRSPCGVPLQRRHRRWRRRRFGVEAARAERRYRV